MIINAAHYSSKSPSPLQTDRYVGFADLWLRPVASRNKWKASLKSSGFPSSLITLRPKEKAFPCRDPHLPPVYPAVARWTPDVWANKRCGVQNHPYKAKMHGFNFSIDCSTFFGRKYQGQNQICSAIRSKRPRKSKTNLRSLFECVEKQKAPLN